MSESTAIESFGWARGGEEYEFHRAVRASDQVTVKYKITDISEKAGKSGKLIFITSEKGIMPNF